MIKKHNIQPNEIKIVALNTPREKDMTLKNSDVTLYSINGRGDLIQQIGSDYASPYTIPQENVDITIFYDDKVKSDIPHFFVDVNHIEPDDENVPQWLPKLRESIDKLMKDKALHDKRLEEHKKANPYDYLDENKETHK
ncbi:hypothetical protein [Flavobacterium aestuarii]|uniref:hypothetical protein n=1 Tax=Flavobacterium aestuarii TaxID=3149227 RepID=UPI0032B32E54